VRRKRSGNIMSYLKAKNTNQEDSRTNKKPVRLTPLLLAQQEYIDLLCEELDELAGLAYSHGWKSSRVEEGEKLRQKIEQLKTECK